MGRQTVPFVIFIRTWAAWDRGNEGSLFPAVPDFDQEDSVGGLPDGTETGA
jgi:hypothetical protein